MEQNRSNHKAEALESYGAYLRRVVWMPIWHVFGELVTIIFGLAFLWFWSLNHVMAERKVDVTFLKLNASLWLANVFDGHQADIGQITLERPLFSDRLSLNVRDIVVKDKFRAELQSIESVNVDVDLRSLLEAQFVPRALSVSGGSVTWLRDKDGIVTAGLGTPQTVGGLGLFKPQMPHARPHSEPAPVSQDTSPSRFNIGGLDDVKVQGATVYIVDEVTGFSRSIDDLTLTLNQLSEGKVRTEDDMFTLTGALNLDQEVRESEQEPNVKEGTPSPRLALNAKFSRDLSSLDVNLQTRHLNPKDYVLGEQMQFAANVDMPVDMDVTFKRDAGVLKEIGVEASAQGGLIEWNGDIFPVQAVALTGAYDPESDRIDISDLKFRSPLLSGQGTGRLLSVSESREKLDYALTLQKLVVSTDEGFLPSALNISDVGLKAKTNRQTLNTDIERLRLTVSDFPLDLSAKIRFDTKGKLAGLSGKGGVSAPINAQQLLSVWPIPFADGARRWIDNSVKEGLVNDIAFKFNVDEQGLSGEPLAEDDIDLTFNVSGGRIQIFSTMDHYQNVSGAGHLRGNSFSVTSVGGNVGPLLVDTAHVTIPRLNPHGGDFAIAVKGQGELPDMLRLIDQEPFRFTSQYGLKAEEFSGRGNITLDITRPLLVHFDKSRIKYSASGLFNDVSAPVKFGDYGLEKGTLLFKADKTGLQLDGPINIGPWTSQLHWADAFDGKDSPAAFTVKGKMDRDTLDRFGIGGRAFFTGEAEMELSGVGAGTAIDRASFTADLTQATITVGDRWQKNSGETGSASGRISTSPTDGVNVSDLSIKAPGLSVLGGLSLGSDLRLISFDVPQISIDGFMDGAMTVKPNASREKFVVNISGDYLDVSPFVAQSLQRNTGGASMPPMEMTGQIDTLMMHEAYVLKDSQLGMEHDGNGFLKSSFEGQTNDGDFSAFVEVDPQDGTRRMRFDVPDVSKAAFAFFNIKNMQGGRMRLETELPPTTEDGPITGHISMDEFVLKDTPVLAKILSLASFKGLSDTMAGTGLTFTLLEVPFSYEQGVLHVRDGRASGPALGLTGSGDVDFSKKTIDLDGVLVPSYNANSVLGAIPVLGDIIVGKDGEGIFALNYVVKGPFKETQVSVNPLSAMTPGFLRRIFDANREEVETGISDEKAPEADKASEAEPDSETSESELKQDE